MIDLLGKSSSCCSSLLNSFLISSRSEIVSNRCDVYVLRVLDVFSSVSVIVFIPTEISELNCHTVLRLVCSIF